LVYIWGMNLSSFPGFRPKISNRILLRWLLFFSLVFLWWYYNLLPGKLFPAPTSTILFDRKDNLLSARISEDGQWRFPAEERVPRKFMYCLLQFEDRKFPLHKGVSLTAIGRAAIQNFKAGRVVSGGSTITMQLARMSRNKKRRNLWEKLMEIIFATRLEFKYNKAEILALYASNAPFGGNVVGLEAASWRYFGRSAENLSWAESATLAILPNAPGLIFPGKNQERLFAKRNRLLKSLFQSGFMDHTTYSLAVKEPIPPKPFAIPQHCPHLLQQCVKSGMNGMQISSTIDGNLQRSVGTVINRSIQKMRAAGINNMAILVAGVRSGEILAYHGNVIEESGENGSAVDVIQAPRSTGSILKPLLYLSMLEDGKLMPHQLVQDVPTCIGGYSPKNFNPGFDGAVPAHKALSRSLNIPAVKMLNEYGVEKFQRNLQSLGLTTLSKPASHYGLSLILGGAEANLWELGRLYAGLAAKMNSVNEPEKQRKGVPEFSFLSGERKFIPYEKFPDPGLIWSTFEAMVEVGRPDVDAAWKSFASSSKIAWKTGTSFGFRDGWAIGVNPDYVVAVWVGNADGEGRPGITGVLAAAPAMFEVFSLLPPAGWFQIPADYLHKIPVCKKSGHRMGPDCPEADTIPVPTTCLGTTACPYHKKVFMNKKETFRVTRDCEKESNMVEKTVFVLPPLMEKFYLYKNPGYVPLPPFKPECGLATQERNMALIYPRPESIIQIPKTQDGSLGRAVLEVVHRRPGEVIFWHLDDVYLGTTRNFHQMEVAPSPGKHLLTLYDESGNSLSARFEVLSAE
jgi:penicillin-binding protein 1C